jgi:DNA (cytosine-5)-methyltransferase 1
VNHLSLFSGVGGLDLAAEWAGFVTVGFVERDKFCQRVLAKHWPGVPIWDDVCNVTAETVADSRIKPGQVRRCDSTQDHCSESERGNETIGGEDRQFAAMGRTGADGSIDLISGGFPCQPHSVAGKRQASADERDLWSECARIVGEFRPRWCVFENVPGLLSSEGGSFFARVLGDLAALGYGVGWATYGAVDVGAPHRRDRVFIVAHRNGRGLIQRQEDGRGDSLHRQVRQTEEEDRERIGEHGPGPVGAMADAGRAGREERDPTTVADGSGHGAWRSDASGRCWELEPPVGRVASGISRRVDRLRALGNAVVPQQAFPIFRAIAEIEGIYRG